MIIEALAEAAGANVPTVRTSAGGSSRSRSEIVESLRQSKYVEVLDAYPEITLVRGPARFGSDSAVYLDGTAYPARTRL